MSLLDVLVTSLESDTENVRTFLTRGKIKDARKCLNSIQETVEQLRQALNPPAILPDPIQQFLFQQHSDDNHLLSLTPLEDSLSQGDPIKMSLATCILEFEAELAVKVDQIFFSYLAQLCSDLGYMDSEGNRIHTNRYTKVDEFKGSCEFHQFKFRIAPFITGLRDALILSGIHESMIPDRKVRHYIDHHRYVARFLDKGKHVRAKSNGFYVFVVEARKTLDDGWIFKEFERKISGPEPVTQLKRHEEWSYAPIIYDPHIKDPKCKFQSPWLPSWLRWEGQVLKGTPEEDARDCTIIVIATYKHSEIAYKLEKRFNLTFNDSTSNNVQTDDLYSIFAQGNVTDYSSGTFWHK